MLVYLISHEIRARVYVTAPSVLHHWVKYKNGNIWGLTCLKMFLQSFLDISLYILELKTTFGKKTSKPQFPFKVFFYDIYNMQLTIFLIFYTF